MKMYGLIGYPLGHSFSKKYFTHKFEEEQSANRFENFAIENINLLPQVLQTHPELAGLCVTIPYKQQVIPFLHESAPEVEIVGACNCIRIKNKRLKGFNTDIAGFEQSLRQQLQPYHKRALILGTGGASKAVEYVLKKLGIAYTLVSRNAKQGHLNYSMLNAGTIAHNLLIINATPLGTFPEVDKCPDIPYEGIGKEHFLFDLIYNPEKTLFLAKGEARGATIQNGYNMLVAQAEANWEIWNA